MMTKICNYLDVIGFNVLFSFGCNEFNKNGISKELIFCKLMYILSVDKIEWKKFHFHSFIQLSKCTKIY